MKLVAALAWTLLAQTMLSVAVFAPGVLAPVAHADIGVPASAIGIFTALVYALGACSAPLGSTFVARKGPVRVSQLCLLASGCGIAVVALPHPLTAMLGAMLIGCGYGPITPASSEILVTRTPERLRNLVISIRQAGIPLGGVLAGALLPMLMLAVGWKTTALTIGGASLLAVLAMQLVRERYDGGRHQAAVKPRPSIIGLLRMVFAHTALRQNALASFFYSGIQMCLASYLVVFLTERVQLTLVNAGFALSAAMVGGIIGRVLWGVLADAIGSSRLVLGALGIVMALSSFVLSQAAPAWPFSAIIALSFVFGATAIGWNGVYIAEIARVAPGGNVAVATGASLTFTYLGVVVSPPAFWLTLHLSGSYALAFILLGAVTLAAALFYFRGSAGRA